MSAVGQIAPRSHRRLAAWLAGDRRRRGDAVDATSLVARNTFAEIGEFIFANGLSLTAGNLDAALRYVSGSDNGLCEKVTALFGQHGRISDAMMDKLVAEITPRMINAEMIHGLADKLHQRLDECVGLVARSSESASSYRSAFDEGVAQLDAGQVSALSELQSTARDLARTTREMQAELDRHRHEASKLRAELQSARREAERDHLTGLPNRRCFEARIKNADRPGASLVVALCDIDNFKAINDEHGHQTGDRVLRLVGAHLEKELKGKALVARYGGEEFALFFPRIGAGPAAAAIDQARCRLAARALVDQDSGRAIRRVTFSAGVALLDGDVGTAMRAADHALYGAKRRGKDQVLLSEAAIAIAG